MSLILVNSTCPNQNDTLCGSSGASATGPAVGLTLFFLLLGVAAIVMYTQRRRLRAMLQPGGDKSKENDSQTPEDSSPRYTGMVRTQQSTGQAAIYENFKGQPHACSPTVIDMSRSLSEPEEDWYLQCDAQDEAIYNNDPACSLSVLPVNQEEDVYIVPDAI